MEYETEAHTFMLGASLKPMAKLSFNLTGSYTKGTGNISELSFAHLETSDVKLSYNVSALNPNQIYLYDTAYINGISAYSDADFKELDVTLGVAYRLTKQMGIGLNYYYTDYQDDAPYVYRDESNTLQSLVGYLTYSF
jgi:opacity protein-like surface antigen